MKYLGTIVVLAVNLFFSAGPPSANWDLRRNVGNGACFVQPSDSSPVGELLKTHPTRKAACGDAKARKTDDAGDKTKCFTYTTGTKDECKREGVDLND
jgi:hypothetical protein